MTIGRYQFQTVWIQIRTIGPFQCRTVCIQIRTIGPYMYQSRTVYILIRPELSVHMNVNQDCWSLSVSNCLDPDQADIPDLGLNC